LHNDLLFSLSGALAMAGWAGLVFAPRWTFTRDWFAPVVIPLLIATLYAWLMAANLGRTPDGGGFDSLTSVSLMFGVPELLLAGWIHYLAFDLFVGAWELRDSQRHGIAHLLVVPCLGLTFVAGPAGLLLYWLVRSVHHQLRRTSVPA
jgi:hypothetical protein